MSLDQLRALRRNGKRPASVAVLIGHPRPFDDGPGIVTVSRADEDLRALLGLSVHVIDVQADPGLTLAVIAALEALSVRPLGICGPAGACGVSPDHEWAMDHYRRSLL